MKHHVCVVFFLFLVFNSYGQFYSIGHENMFDPVLFRKKEFHSIHYITSAGNNVWDNANLKSYVVMIFRDGLPTHEIYYQTDLWGNPSFLAVGSGIKNIMESERFPAFRFAFECRKIEGAVEGKQKINALLSLLVSILNEMDP